MMRSMGTWLFAATLVLSLQACKVPDKPAPPVAPPAITAFTVDAAHVTAGQSVHFSFATERATSVALVDDSGAEVPVTFDAAAGTGTATHTPGHTTFYVLRALGDGGRDAAFVQVAVDEDLSTLFLVVVPRVVRAGEAVDVLWSTGGLAGTLTEGARTLSTEASGTVSDVPAASTQYTLSAQRPDGSSFSTSAAVQVIPVVAELTAEPPSAMPGETITVSWKAAGAERVALSEATFGVLLDTAVDGGDGRFNFVVPFSTGDAGVPAADAGVDDGGVAPSVVREGLPLRFTLTASTATPPQEVSRTVDARVGRGAIVDRFEAPAAATNDRPFSVRWATRGAARVELLLDGVSFFAPPAGTYAEGVTSVPAPAATVVVELVAWDGSGLATRAQATVRPVAPPVITSFSVPATVPASRGDVQATWRTTGAAYVTLHLERGPTLYFSDVPAEVAMGSHTVRPFDTGRYVLEAFNAAGDSVTASADTRVLAPTGLTFTPAIGGAGQPTVTSWDVSSLPVVDLLGLPSDQPQLLTAPAAFVDLDTLATATTLVFADANDGVQDFDAPKGFRFPFVTQVATHFTASTNGALLLGRGLAGNQNRDVSDPLWAGPALLAPFWDDLDLGADGTVKVDLDGDRFPRRLIVQWSKVRLASAGGSELTFQVQLSETGAFTFAWKTLSGAAGATPTIGAVDGPGRFAHSVSFDTAPTVTDGQVLDWFQGEVSRVADSLTFAPAGARPFGFFVKDSNANLFPLFRVPRVIALDAIRIDEVMPVPAPSVPAGQWVELLNTTDETIDLSGFELVSNTGSASPFAFTTQSLDAGQRMVVGQSTDPVQCGQANVSVAWGTNDVSMAPADSVELRTPGGSPFVVSQLSWDALSWDGGSPGGISVQRPVVEVVDVNGAPIGCPRATFGLALQEGTPGARSESCFEYRLDPIPEAWEEIAGTGQRLITAGDDRDNSVDVLTLSPPLRYYGTDFRTVSIGTNGWMATGAVTFFYPFNRTKPSSSLPAGTLAPFWDDLVFPATRPGANVYLERRSDHYVVEWYRAAHNLAPSDEINAQVKLFDDGVIEFHYGQLVSTTPARIALGGEATAWLERPLGTAAAIALIRNQTTVTGYLAPHTAWRFTPVP